MPAVGAGAGDAGVGKNNGPWLNLRSRGNVNMCDNYIRRFAFVVLVFFVGVFAACTETRVIKDNSLDAKFSRMTGAANNSTDPAATPPKTTQSPPAWK